MSESYHLQLRKSQKFPYLQLMFVSILCYFLYCKYAEWALVIVYGRETTQSGMISSYKKESITVFIFYLSTGKKYILSFGSCLICTKMKTFTFMFFYCYPKVLMWLQFFFFLLFLCWEFHIEVLSENYWIFDLS